MYYCIKQFQPLCQCCLFASFERQISVAVAARIYKLDQTGSRYCRLSDSFSSLNWLLMEVTSLSGQSFRSTTGKTLGYTPAPSSDSPTLQLSVSWGRSTTVNAVPHSSVDHPYETSRSIIVLTWHSTANIQGLFNICCIFLLPNLQQRNLVKKNVTLFTSVTSSFLLDVQKGSISVRRGHDSTQCLPQWLK